MTADQPPATSPAAPSVEDFLAAMPQGMGALNEKMGIELVEISAERVVARMPVAGNTQPYGLLHGGASVVLAETLGSIGSALHGYPDRLSSNAISLFAKMGAVCDVYDAITSNRPYKAGWDPAEPIRKMTEWSKGHFDEHVFQAFIKSIGIYPVGSLVRLASGRLAVVVEQSEKSLLAPRVKAFFSTKSQTYIVPELIDLSRPSTTEKIVSREDATKWGITNLDELWAT